jgi:hypothetical protein
MRIDYCRYTTKSTMEKGTHERFDHGVTDDVGPRRQSIVSMSRNITGEYDYTELLIVPICSQCQDSKPSYGCS